nr:MobA/MobL family protein [Orientia tsutsugamushi]
MKDIVIALPDEKELNLEHRIELTHQIVDEMEWVQKGIGVQIDIHKPQIGDKNWHVHILVTMRRFRGRWNWFRRYSSRFKPKNHNS